ncbi:ABC transporter substrate-binding protein [Rhodococcus gannanensis]|uniref:ABC transporter substrate-binding protein n=1 Tax=Rhodococcus gannanensis TaxID=1960308 RepID=A0ABW4PC53_9NOCA
MRTHTPTRDLSRIPPRALPAAAVAVAAALTLTACGGGSTDSDAAAAISLENCGRTVTLDSPAERAVTVSQGATETALSIGAEGRMVGTAYLDDAIAPQWQEAYLTVPVIEESDYPSREALLETRPDLVLSSYGSAFDEKAIGSQDSLAEVGVASYVSPFGCADKSLRAPAEWESISGEITDYGVLFGREAEAAAVVEQQDETLTAVRSAASGAGKSIFWYDSNTDVPYVGANGGGPQLIIDAVGATNIFAGLDGSWVDGNWETVLAANPDVIVLADASWDTAEQKKAYLRSDPALKDLTAVREDRFVVLPFSTTTPGPRLIDGASALSGQLAGERG